MPCPGESTLRYGGNTSCIEVMCSGRRLIFDAGTGIRMLGRQLAAGNEPVSAQLFLTHTHLDHITGLPFFRPVYNCNNSFGIWAGHLLAQGKKIDQTLAKFLDSTFFPVPLEIMRPCLSFTDFTAGDSFNLDGGIEIATAPLNHPGGATAYKVTHAGKTICIVTDTEHVRGKRDETLMRFIGGTDLVIYDSTFTDLEYPRFEGWGHSTWQEGVRLCEAAGVKRLVTFHHDPEHDDTFLDDIAKRLSDSFDGSLVAREGMVLEP